MFLYFSNRSICSARIVILLKRSVIIIIIKILFIHASPIIHVYLSMLFNCFNTHGYLTEHFMKTAIVPIIKKKLLKTRRETQVIRVIVDPLH